MADLKLLVECARERGGDWVFVLTRNVEPDSRRAERYPSSERFDPGPALLNAFLDSWSGLGHRRMRQTGPQGAKYTKHLPVPSSTKAPHFLTLANERTTAGQTR